MSCSDSYRRKFVVGLGNPGREYADTRHNVGFQVLEALRCRWQVSGGRKAFDGRCDEARPQRPESGVRRVLLLEPHTFMNCSGRAVGEMARFHRADCQDILVVLDDLALPLGRLRLRASGSAGGHKGLADVLAALGSESVPRLRIGIGSPPERMDATDFVLTPFADGELEEIARAIQLAAEAVEDWVFHGAEYVMEKYNRKAED